MPFKESTVEAVSVKPMKTPDKFNNTYRYSIMVEKNWYSCGSGKSERLNVKDGKGDYQSLSKGDKVEFKYTENGQWNNIDMKTFSLLEIGDSTSGGNRSVKPVQTVQKIGEFVNPAEVGQCINLAGSVLGFTEQDFTNDAKIKEAISWYKSVRESFSKLYPTVEIFQKPAEDDEHEI